MFDILKLISYNVSQPIHCHFIIANRTEHFRNVANNESVCNIEPSEGHCNLFGGSEKNRFYE
jgi:hypothetical protein